MKRWYLERLPGDGRGGIFFNSEEEFVDDVSGVKICGWDGYDDEDDEDFDDFGSQWYTCVVEGTEEQVKEFIEEHFYGEGTYEEERD